MGGGGQQQTTTKTQLPKWAVPYAQELLGMGAGEFFPGGNLAQMPASMNRQVAGFTPDQMAGISMIQQEAGASPLSNLPSTATLPEGLAPGSSLPTPIAGLNAPPQPVVKNPIPNPITNPKKGKKGKG